MQGLTLLVLVLAFGLPLPAKAAVVGRFTEVEGRVDLLKAGKLPALAVKAQDEVEAGDVVRTKSDARAQIQFIDESTITMAPGSRIAIDEYSYDAARGQRQAVLQVFMGMVHTVVKKIHQVKEPDFILKTQTSVIGVRGTDWYSVLGINLTDVYNGSGKTEVRNIFPEVPGKVDLDGMEFTRVTANLPPTLPLAIDQRDLDMLKMQLSARTRKAETTNLPTTPAGNPHSLAFLREAWGQDNPLTQNNLTIPPSLAQTLQTLQAHLNLISGSYTMNGVSGGVSALITAPVITYSLAGLYPGTYTDTNVNFFLTASSGTPFSVFATDTGNLSGSFKGNVTGMSGGIYSGSVSGTVTAKSATNTVNMNLSGPISIGPGGVKDFKATGTFSMTGTVTTSGTVK